MATAAAVNEGRNELLGWISELLQLNVAKIESIGTGAVLCQIADSIFGDVQLHKVKFNATHEYEYVNNFKVLQATFTRHRVDKFIPVDRLVKLKYMDNLEFLQWMKKFWDTNFPGHQYDAVARRKSSGNGTVLAAVIAKHDSTSKSLRSSLSDIPVPTSAPASSRSSETVTALQTQIATLQEAFALERVQSEGMLKERDFYFEKLREIEYAMQQVTESIILESDLYKLINTILYKTEDGFDLPATSA